MLGFTNKSLDTCWKTWVPFIFSEMDPNVEWIPDVYKLVVDRRYVKDICVGRYMIGILQSKSEEHCNRVEMFFLTAILSTYVCGYLFGFLYRNF